MLADSAALDVGVRVGRTLLSQPRQGLPCQDALELGRFPSPSLQARGPGPRLLVSPILQGHSTWLTVFGLQTGRKNE